MSAWLRRQVPGLPPAGLALIWLVAIAGLGLAVWAGWAASRGRVSADGKLVPLAGGLVLCLGLLPVVQRRVRTRALERDVADRTRKLAEATGELNRKTREAEALLGIAQAACSTLDERELLRHVARGAATALGAERCSIFLVDEARTLVTAVTAQFADGRTDAPMWEAFRALGTLPLQAVPMIGEAVRRREPVVIEEAAIDPRVPRSWTETYRIGALLVVPLIYRDRVIGALALDGGELRAVTPEQARQAVALAEQVGVAVQNARLYADAEKRRREAEVEAELTAAINASLDLTSVLERVTAGAKDLCRSEVAAIALRDPASHAIVLRHHLPPVEGSGPTEAGPRATGSGQPLIGSESGPEYAAIMQREGVVAVVVVPIPGERDAEGLLYVGNHSPRPFGGRDRAILTRLAGHAAAAIRNSRLYAEERARAARITRVNQLSHRVASSLDYRQVSDFVTTSALELLDGDLARLWLVDEEAGVLRLAACSERGAPPRRAAPATELPVGQGVVGRVVATRTKHASPSLRLEPLQAAQEWEGARGYAAQIAVPLLVGERALGALAILTRAPRRFLHEEEDLLALFASQAAAGLENARLFREAQEAYERLQETQGQLAHAQKMEAIGRLAGGVAHDFNNLLTVIKGRSDLLLARLAPEDPTRRQVDLISQTSGRAAALTRQLLAFSRRQVMKPEVLDLNAVVTETSKMLRHLIGEDIELVTALDPALGRVRADAAQLQQVIVNLAVNARDAMPHGGVLRIQTGNVELGADDVRSHAGVRPGPHVALVVRDTGSGMSEEVRTRLFEPFFTTKPPGKGTGLGLATAYGIVNQSGGTIDVQSAPGQGAAFMVYLPRCDDAVPVSHPPRVAAAAPRGRETVLLVEDEAEVRTLARDLLEEAGYVVLEAAKGDEALRIGREHPGTINLLLTDVVMPQMSGPALAERLTRERPDVKTLYMSGYTDDALGPHGVLQPGIALLEKPFTPEVLVAKVREVLDGASFETALAP